MLIRLGKLAIDVNLSEARSLDPMLYRDAFETWQKAPVGSPLELRAALVLIGLGSKELMGATVQLAEAARYIVAALGSALFGVVEDAGGDPRDARAGAQALFAARRKEAEAARAEATRAPARSTPTQGPGRPVGASEARVEAEVAGGENAEGETPDTVRDGPCVVELAPAKEKAPQKKVVTSLEDLIPGGPDAGVERADAKREAVPPDQGALENQEEG
jgi:hypothetical protein